MEVLAKSRKKEKQFYVVQNALMVSFRDTHFELDAGYDRDYYVIRINYTDGASLSRVKNAVRAFNCPSNPGINFQGTRVEVKRTMSAGVKKQLLNELKTIFKLKTLPEESDWFEPIKGTVGNYMDKIFSMRDFN
ncbi:MAG TPA: hypothetical protein PKC55_10505 [Dysgonomonas sp.]|uniref:hypothetical protein n=1 Tax=unclassified Dysgonomonas TaxID=2630389 RepID=UPI0025C6FC71|nr:MULTISPECIES: hypothetical protein [unclassified Dysgonomonas]HML65251.1 hypothetical protein [Dysgonomonas sp.]